MKSNPYLKAALLTVSLVALGFFFISQLDAMRASELRNSVSDLAFQSDSERFLLLYTQVMGNSTTELCGYASNTTAAKAARAYDLSQRIQYYEQSNLLNSEYERIRNQYYLANAELYLNFQENAKYCGASKYSTVLFFYRISSDCPECRAQGGVLDSLRARHPEMQVFAFPIDTDNQFVNVFALRSHVSSVPSLVINDKVVLAGLKSEAEVEKYLGGAAG